jgi:D-alanyl-lipoteichoic acid acyltransferase DltB (MBOAT superfamily)
MDFRDLLHRFVKNVSIDISEGIATPRDKGPTLQSERRLGKFVILVAQLGLLTLVIRQFQIESNAFLRIALLTFCGFVIHYFLQQRYRLPFFLLLSLTGIGIVLGVLNAIWLIGIGLILIGICHLPLSFTTRVLLLLFTGVLLAVLRMDWFHAPWPVAIWPILGSMFMFRLIAYLYDLKHEKAPVSIPRALAYFFMLPNVCFPLFPVVDYKTFRRNYYNSDPHQIYQIGIDWMTRGVIHLILYRFVYYYLTMAPSEVAGPSDLMRFMISNFLLYLRVSGQFHLIVGMLHLFGFSLPETHHRYYLASSFTDFWRRINIYWKDFMLKVFYYPLYFKLRTWGITKALVISTLWVFLATWFLHSYQWFWLRGSFLLAWQDVLFWGILALLVIINSLYEAKHGRDRTLGKHSWTLRNFAMVALSTVGTFSVICALWSLWTSESLSAWISLWASVGEGATVNVRLIPTLLVAVVVLGSIVPDKVEKPQRKNPQGVIFRKSTIVTVISLLFLSIVGIPAIYSRLGSTSATVIHSLRSGKLSRLDTAKIERGYYEDLLQVDRFNSQLWEVYMNKPLHWLDVQGAGLERFTDNFLQKELIPSFVAFTSHGPIHINRWGMRDQDYERQPTPNTHRIALLGASTVMGWGVEDNQTFEVLLEDHLNREHAGKYRVKYEILNFGTPGYQPLQQLMVLEEKAFAFGPNTVFYVAAGREASRSALYLAEVVRNKVDIPYDYLRKVVQQAGIDAKTPETFALKRLEPFRNEMLSWLYRRIVQGCKERGSLPVWIFLPQVREGLWQEETAGIFQIAEEAGFIILDLSDVYKNQDITSLRLAEWDDHPNVKGHQLIAARLYEAILEKEALIFPYLHVQPEKS